MNRPIGGSTGYVSQECFKTTLSISMFSNTPKSLSGVLSSLFSTNSDQLLEGILSYAFSTVFLILLNVIRGTVIFILVTPCS